MTMISEDPLPHDFSGEPVGCPPEEELQALLARYREISISRERAGEIFISQELARHGLFDRLYRVRFGMSPDYPVSIEVVDVPWNNPGNWAQDNTYLLLLKVGEDNTNRVEVHRPRSEIEAKDVLDQVKKGLEIFAAFQQIPRTSRNRFGGRVYDGMHPEGLIQDGIEAEIIREGEEKDLFAPLPGDSPEDWRLIQVAISRDVSEVVEVP